VCGRDHTTDPALVLARWQDQDICTECLAAHAEMQAEDNAMPDRLASRLVLAVMETLAFHDVLLCAEVDDDAAITAINTATDAAIEEVEKLLRQD
jgi:uncharacterized protein with GYD domain